jgi:hypothetical protein
MPHRSSAVCWTATALLASLVLLASPAPAYAYIDPGAGSMLYQALLAALLGLAFTLRSARDWITRTVRGLFGSKPSSESDRSSAKRPS